MSAIRIMSDVGGTNVRFAISDVTGHVEHLRSFSCSQFASFDDALRTYLSSANLPALGPCVIAAAGPVIDDRVELTNNAWSIEGAAIASKFGFSCVQLMNDLEAVAAALPHLGENDFRPIGTEAGQTTRHPTLLALNVGTGFGAAAAIHHGDRYWTCASEAGHMSLHLDLDGPAPAHIDLTIEDVLSGIGLGALYEKVARSRGQIGAAPHFDRASDIFKLASRDVVAAHTLSIFTRLMGRVAGDLVLAHAAWGGVYFCGSVAQQWAGFADPGEFRATFESKGPLSQRLKAVPSALIEHSDIAMLGMTFVDIDRAMPAGAAAGARQER